MSDLRFLRPWVFGALVWLMLSAVVSLEHLRSARPDHLFELSGFMTFLWLEFCFAGMFHTLRKEKRRETLLLLLITLIPPLTLFCIDLVLLWLITGFNWDTQFLCWADLTNPPDSDIRANEHRYLDQDTYQILTKQVIEVKRMLSVFLEKLTAES